MSQEDMKQSDKGFSRTRPRDDSGNNGSRKGPRFNLYWVWGVIIAIFFGVQIFNPFNADIKDTNLQEFKNVMLANGDVDSYTIIDNRNLVKIYIKKDSLQKQFYKNKLSKGGSFAFADKTQGPQFQLTITKGESFETAIRDFYVKNPGVKEVTWNVKQEGDLFTPIFQFVFPILIIVLIWILLMRKMGGGAGSGAGPGGIFNIGKSKATLFDKGTKVNITFNDVAGLDEAKVEVMVPMVLHKFLPGLQPKD